MEQQPMSARHAWPEGGLDKRARVAGVMWEHSTPLPRTWLAADRGRALVDVIGVQMGYSFMSGDAEQVPIKEDAYMLPPKDWIEKQLEAGVELPDKVVWKRKKEWYGRRIAGQCFVERAAGRVKELGFTRNVAAPWLFHDTTKGILMEVHMDDFFATGPQKSLVELEKELRLRVKMKSQIREVHSSEADSGDLQ